MTRKEHLIARFILVYSLQCCPYCGLAITFYSIYLSYKNGNYRERNLPFAGPFLGKCFSHLGGRQIVQNNSTVTHSPWRTTHGLNHMVKAMITSLAHRFSKFLSFPYSGTVTFQLHILQGAWEKQQSNLLSSLISLFQIYLESRLVP